MKLRVYTDGACSGNPGVGGWGVFFKPLNVRLCGGKEMTTNNEMELTAIYVAIDSYEKYGIGPGDEIVLCSDSAYCVNIFTQWIRGWIEQNKLHEKKNWELILKIYKRIEQIQKALPLKITFEKVPGHAGIYENEMADTLARKGLQNAINKVPEQVQTVIVYIATGKYLEYLPGFLSTIEKFNVPGKVIELFTDQDINIPGVNVNKIEYHYWPITVLNKFRYIIQALKKHKDAESVWYFDSKVEFRKTFTPYDVKKVQVFPHTTWKHVYEKNHNSIEKAYNTYHWGRRINEKSKCYFDFATPEIPYIQSAAFGGDKNSMMVMCAVINEWVKIDLMHNIIPMWHDESYLNGFAHRFPEKVIFREIDEMGEIDNPNSNTNDPCINFRNTDEIQQEKQRIYNS